MWLALALPLLVLPALLGFSRFEQRMLRSTPPAVVPAPPSGGVPGAGTADGPQA